MIQIIDTATVSDFTIFTREDEAKNEEIEKIVEGILENVKKNGDSALYEYCEKMYSTESVESSLYVLTVGGVKNSVKCSYSAQIKTLDKRKITVELYTMPFVYSPVKKGNIIGKAVIKYKEKEIASCNITAQEDVEYYVKQK